MNIYQEFQQEYLNSSFQWSRGSGKIIDLNHKKIELRPCRQAGASLLEQRTMTWLSFMYIYQKFQQGYLNSSL